jgi:hypothetical protein
MYTMTAFWAAGTPSGVEFHDSCILGRWPLVKNWVNCKSWVSYQGPIGLL